jgi:hypothetical protein
MPCTLIAKYKDYAHERHKLGDTVPSAMTLIDYTLRSVCTESGCDHPRENADDLVLDFDKHGLRWTDNGTEYIGRPKTGKCAYEGPLENSLVREGTLTIYSEHGWTAMDTSIGRTSDSIQGVKVKSHGSAKGTEETGTTKQ